MKILFVIVDGGGNIPPQLAVARALQARGVEIHVLGHSGIRERVEAAGLKVWNIGNSNVHNMPEVT